MRPLTNPAGANVGATSDRETPNRLVLGPFIAVAVVLNDLPSSRQGAEVDDGPGAPGVADHLNTSRRFHPAMSMAHCQASERDMAPDSSASTVNQPTPRDSGSRAHPLRLPFKGDVEEVAEPLSQ
jgi:hypothetical protein